MQRAIETNQLVKRYGSVTAVDHLSLSVLEGEIYAFLGLNGAGKTTAIRMLLGMVTPTSGTATVLGTLVRPGSRSPWAAVGYLVERPRAYPELTVYENLDVARRYHPATPPAAIDQVIDLLALGSYANRRARHLSQGNAQRLGLAKAFLHKPRLLILDEPANGLDPAGTVEIRELLGALARDQGVTVLMSSHRLGEVARMAQRIGIIHHGQLVQELSARDLQENRRKTLHVRARNLARARDVLAGAGLVIGQGKSDGLTIRDPQAVAHPDTIATSLVHAGVPPTHLYLEEEELETYFLRLIGQEQADVDTNPV